MGIGEKEGHFKGLDGYCKKGSPTARRRDTAGQSQQYRPQNKSVIQTAG